MTARILPLFILGLQFAGIAPGTGGEPVEIPTIAVDVATLGHRPLILDGRIWSMAFSADSSTLLAAADSVYRVDWRSKEANPIWRESENETMIWTIFSPDGRLFARCENGKRVHLHRSTSCELLLTITGSADRVYGAVAWSADSKSLAIGGSGEILVHRSDTGELQQRIPQGGGNIAALAWSADGRWIAAANLGEAADDTVLLHSLDGGTPPIALPAIAKRSIKPHFSFSPDSKTLAVFASNHEGRESLFFWDLKTQSTRFRRKHGGSCYDLAHSPDGKWLAAGNHGNLVVLDAHTGKQCLPAQAPNIYGNVLSLAFSPDGNLLGYAADDRIRFMDTRTWAEVDPADDLRAPVTAMAFSSDGRSLVTGGLNGDLLLWDLERKSPIWRQFPTTPSGRVVGLSVDSADRWIGVAQYPARPERRQIHLVDFATGNTSRYLSLSDAQRVAPLFVPSGTSVWLAQANDVLVEWDFNTDSLLRKIPIPLAKSTRSGEVPPVHRLVYDTESPESILCEANGAWGRIHPESQEQTASLGPPPGRLEPNPIPPRNNEWIIDSDSLYVLPTFHEVKLRIRPQIPIVKHPSGWLLFMAGYEKLEIFDLLSLSVIRRLSFGPGEMKAMALSPDGNTLVMSTTGGLFPVELHEKGQPSPHITAEVLWQVMGSENHWEAYQAAWSLAQLPDFLPFLKKHLKPAEEPTPELLTALQAQLLDANHEIRQSAARSRLDLGLSLDQKTYLTLYEGGLPPTEPSKFYHPEDYPLIVIQRGPDPIPPLLPLADYRRLMRAVMILTDDHSPESLRQLEHLATGNPTAPLTLAAEKAVKIRNARAR